MHLQQARPLALNRQRASACKMGGLARYVRVQDFFITWQRSFLIFSYPLTLSVAARSVPFRDERERLTQKTQETYGHHHFPYTPHCHSPFSCLSLSAYSRPSSPPCPRRRRARPAARPPMRSRMSSRLTQPSKRYKRSTVCFFSSFPFSLLFPQYATVVTVNSLYITHVFPFCF